MGKFKFATKELRKFDCIMRKNGWKLIRVNGDHYKYKKGNRTVVIPASVNTIVTKRLMRENDIM